MANLIMIKRFCTLYGRNLLKTLVSAFTILNNLWELELRLACAQRQHCLGFQNTSYLPT